MADFLQQLRLGGTTYDFYDSEFIIDNRNSGGAALTGVSKASELFDGMQITYWLNQAAGANATLNLTLSNNETTGAIPIYYSGTTRLGIEYEAGSVLKLIYRSNVTIGETSISSGWWVDANDSKHYLPLEGGTMEGRVNLPGAPLNPGFTGTGVAARDAGSGASPRYFPAKWTFNTGFTATNNDVFFLEVPVAGHSNGVYISVDNGQHYYPAVVQTTSRLTTHYAVGNLVAFVFEADGSAASMYDLDGGDARVTVTGGVFRVFNYYDANTNTLQRTFRSTTNIELPVAGISTSSSATAAYSAISSGSYKDVYAAIPNDTAKVVSLNPSTGYLTFKALTANQAVKTDANKRLVSNNLAVTTATDETTEATRFVHSVTEDAVGKITVKTRPMPTIPNVPNAPTTAGNYNLNVNNGTVSWQEESYPSEILNITASPSNNGFTTNTLYTDFITAVNTGKIIQILISSIMASGILVSRSSDMYYNFNFYSNNTIINYVFTTDIDPDEMVEFIIVKTYKPVPSSFSMDIPNAGKYVLNSTGSSTSWVESFPTDQLERPQYLASPLQDVTLRGEINDLRANHLAFLPPSQVIVETTTDGGVTWVDAGLANYMKADLFAETRANIGIPLLNGEKNVNCGLRITFTAMRYNVPANTPETEKYNYWNRTYVIEDYTEGTERQNKINEMYFFVNAASQQDTVSVKLERAKGNSSTTWETAFDSDTLGYGMSGWPDGNYISFESGSFGNAYVTANSYWNYRLTFFTRGPNGSKTLSGTYKTSKQHIREIRGYGESYQIPGNAYASRDHLYSWDYNQNATFPAAVTATSLSGNYLTLANTVTIANGDQLLIADASQSNQIKRSTITFGTDTSSYLRNDGTWASITVPAAPTKGTLSLTTSWSGSEPYTQTVSITGGTANSKIDLQPDATVLSSLITDGVTAMYIENNNGTFTAYALGAAPSAALSIQYTRTEVTS